MAYRSHQTDEEKPKARNDAYTGLLAISFVAMIIGCALLFVDWYQYNDLKPARVQLPPIKASGAPRIDPKVEKDPPPPPDKAKADDKAKMEEKGKDKMDEKGKDKMDEKGKDKADDKGKADAKDKADAKEKKD